MHYRTDDVRIKWIKVVLPPAFLQEDYPVSDRASATVHNSREGITKILNGEDDRLLVVVGPCSIHDVQAARDYAQRLKELAAELAQDLLLVMRVYFEKPRTTVGWKGLINDPYLDGSFKINDGLRLARHLLLDLAEMGVPAGTEFLDLITPQYLADLVSWGAIEARTTESQAHRELASGLSCPVGFKNGTSGNLQIAIDAVMPLPTPTSSSPIQNMGLPQFLRPMGIPTAILFSGVVEPRPTTIPLASRKPVLSSKKPDCRHA
jgi:3-deoxy-7-phosphoheptulonate synthase